MPEDGDEARCRTLPRSLTCWIGLMGGSGTRASRLSSSLSARRILMRFEA